MCSSEGGFKGRKERKKCHFWGYRISWAPLNLIPLQLMGRITEQPIALPGLLWTWSLWCILITNNWHKLNLVSSQQLWQEHFALVQSHENVIANLWGLSAVWHRNVVLANGCGDTQWGEVKGISGFIWAQGLENTTLFALDRVIVRVRGESINLSHLEFSCRSFQ